MNYKGNVRSSHILIGEADVLLHTITLYGQAILSIDIWREGRKKGGEGGRERQTMEGGRRREVGEIDGWLNRTSLLLSSHYSTL